MGGAEGEGREPSRLMKKEPSVRPRGARYWGGAKGQKRIHRLSS